MLNNIIMKVLFSNPINPFGGLNLVLKSFKESGIDHLIEESLPSLPAQSKFQWADILFSFWSIYFCGGDCIEDCGKNFRHFFRSCPLFKVCSPDRVLFRFKQLSQPKTYPSSKRSSKKHEFGINLPLNRLCLQLLNQTRAHQEGVITIDYDNTLLFTKKADSVTSYLKRRGYCPGIGFLNNQAFYIENRNGNSDAGSFQVQTLKRMFKLLEEQDIYPHQFRADSASYQWAIVKLLSEKVDCFYLRARRTEDLAPIIKNIKDWEPIKIGNEIQYRGEAKHVPFKSVAHRAKETDELVDCRIVVTKAKRRDGQIDLFTGEAFCYSTILTNDFTKSKDQVVAFYNQRGSVEKEFDILKNDFGWKNMPFSKLEQNTVFLILTAICRNLYHWIINQFSKQYKWLKPNYRIKKFIYRFISIPAKWVRHARQKTLIFYGMLPSRPRVP